MILFHPGWIERMRKMNDEKDNLVVEKKKNRHSFSLIRILFLIFLLMGNTLAWFIYVTRIDNSVSVHVKSWDVVFQDGEEEVSTNVNIAVDDLYPGMNNFHYQISAYNKSEVDAYLTYTLMSANVLGTEYVTVEGRADRGETVQEDDYTSAELEDMFLNEFPFSLQISLSNLTIGETDGLEYYSFDVTWPYESGNDIEDTRWGIAAADFKRTHPGVASITLVVKVSIVQDT